MDKKLKKVIYMSLAGTLLGVLLFMFGIYISKNIFIIDLIYYIMCAALLLISFLMVKNNYKNYRRALLIYIMGIDIFFIGLTTVYMFINHF